MKTTKLLVATVIFLMGYATTASASQCPSINVVSDPQIFDWTHHPVTESNLEEYYSGTLEIGEATLNVGGDTITTRAYRQPGHEYSIPGPTLKMSPGNKYVLRFKNTLPYEAPSMEHNVFKDPNISNVHTHGLHISGETPSDDVTRSFEGGYGGDFVYDIPVDHMGGTYWYHAHHHGSTFLQVSGGAFGLIIIDDSWDNVPTNVTDMEEKHLVIAYLDPDAAGTGGDTLISGTLSPTWTTNGTIAGNVCLPKDTWQHWRILLADRDAKPKTVTVGSQCEVALMARDGVWRTEAPKILTDKSINLTGASRADFAVRCSDDSTITVDNEAVANIFVDGVADPTVHPFAEDGTSLWSAYRPDYLRDLRYDTPGNTETINMGARTISGSKFDINEPTFTLPADAMQEWTLKGAKNHPFHLHVYHVQVVGDCGEYEDGEYYDVVAGNCTVRFDLSQSSSTVYEGRTIMHCHILEHEDQGAMGWADVLGGIAPPDFPLDGDIGLNYQPYYPLTAGNPPSAVQVGSITVSTVKVEKGIKRGQAVVVVTDDQGGLVENAVVTGEFSGSISESQTSNATDANGVATLETTGTAKGGLSLTFCVLSITHPTLQDFTAAAEEACNSL